ncbi:nucleoside hydrolase [Pendulispora brunnea]|uniref:Nucleoside hydrolase n=1 Tax=Pendulispora brunnea TaxID=2905690 RepID=A0ABZ2KQ16_9BACT
MSPSAETNGALPLLVDTDICADVDDIGALAMVNSMHSRGEVRLLGVMVDTRGNAGAAAVDVVNTYYGHPDIPIGALQPTDASKCDLSHDYVGHLVERFPHDLTGGSAAPNAIHLYRKLLAAEKDHSVVIVSVGAATNLAALLDSRPDAASALSGAELVSRKVARLVLMGGKYPYSDTGPEFNFKLDPAGTRHAVDHWPTPITFSGLESFVKLGKRVSTEAPLDSPVRMAFEIGYGPGVNHDAWDMLPILYAARRGRYFTEKNCGFNRISDDGSNRCTVDVPSDAKESDSIASRQRYLRFSDPEGRATATIEDMLVTGR